MENRQKWIKDYTEGVDTQNIQWLQMDANELYKFFETNYLDKDLWKFVQDEEVVSINPVPLGMKYLSFYSPQVEPNHSFLLGVADNNIGKKTIVAATVYREACLLYAAQKEPITYIITMEVNSYFRQRGVFKEMCEALINCVNPNERIITSRESDEGETHHAFETLKSTLESHGFAAPIVKYDPRVHILASASQKVIEKNKKTGEI